MRKNVCLKATWRQPWRTMLLLLFCAGLTFAFLSQVLQYWVIQDAVADSAGYYHAVGALRTENTEAEDAFPSLSVLEKSEYVDYVNTYVSRYGTMQDVFNTDLNGDLNNHILYLQGTFREITKETEKPLCMYAQKYVPREVAYLTFDITNLFSGHPEMASLGEMRFRMDVTQNRDFMNRLQEELQPGESYLFCAQWKKYYYRRLPSLVIRCFLWVRSRVPDWTRRPITQVMITNTPFQWQREICGTIFILSPRGLW